MNLADRLQQLSFGKAMMMGLVIAGLYWVIGYDSGSNFQTQITKQVQTIEDKKAEVKAVDRQIERANTYRKAVEELGNELNQFLEYIPEKLSMAEMMRTISTEAKTAGTNIVKISEASGAGGGAARPRNSFGREADQDQFYDILSVSIKLEGTYSQLLLFLSYLTKLDKIFTVRDLKLRSDASPDSTETPKVTFTSTIVGYKYTGGTSNENSQ